MTAGEKYVYIKVKGNCMVPNINYGDSLLVKSVDKSSLKPQDIIAFSRKGNLFAHRIVKIIGNGAGTIFLTKGDRGIFLESPVGADCLVGKVIAVIRDNALIDVRKIRMGFYDKLLFYLSCWINLLNHGNKNRNG